MNASTHALVERLFETTKARDVKPSLPKKLPLGEFPDWFGEFMKKRFRRIHGRSISAQELVRANQFIEHRAHNPRTWGSGLPAN